MSCDHRGEGLPDCKHCTIIRRGRAITALKRENPSLPHAEAVARAMGRESLAGRQAAESPCRFRGTTLRLAPCAGCGGGKTVEAFACELHGECTNDTQGRKTRGVRSCGACKDREPPQPREIVPGLVDPVQTPVNPKQERGWPWLPEVVEDHVAALELVVERSASLTPPSRSGQGVLIGGEGRYWIGVVICCRLLREVGYTGRILVWGRTEAGPCDLSLLDGLGVEFTDASAYIANLPPSQRPRIFDGWGSKTFAVMHCGLERVIWIDSDAYFVRDPTPMFRLLDRSPFCYWEDHSSNVRGPWHGLARCEVQAVPPVQSGQFVVDVVRHWRCLAIARWMDDHSDYFCARGFEPRNLLHQWGDQDSHRVALAYTGAPHWQIDRAEWKGFHFTHRFLRQVYVVHRCGSKLFPGTEPRWDDALPLESRVKEMYGELTAPPPKVELWAEMPAHQRQRVLQEIQSRVPCRVLVFGAGTDTIGIVQANRGGRTVVLEDRHEWFVVGRKAGAECYLVNYVTRAGMLLDACHKLAVPNSVEFDRFDVILIDGPCGMWPDAPGRQQPAELASRLIAPGGVILAHDAQRGADADAYARHLGQPAEVVSGPPDLAVYGPIIQQSTSEEVYNRIVQQVPILG